MHEDPTRMMGQPDGDDTGPAATCACWSPAWSR